MILLMIFKHCYKNKRIILSFTAMFQSKSECSQDSTLLWTVKITASSEAALSF